MKQNRWGNSKCFKKQIRWLILLERELLYLPVIIYGLFTSVRFILLYYMSAKKSLIYTLAILLFTCKVMSASSQSSSQPLPINSSQLFTLEASPADGRLILSPQLQNLKIEHEDNSGIFSTMFTLQIYNRSASNYLSTYELTLPNKWNHVRSSPQSHSCSVIYDDENEVIGLLQFNVTAEELELVTQFPLSNLTSEKMTAEELRPWFRVGENCNVFSFEDRNTSVTDIYHGDIDWTMLSLVTLPQNWQVTASTQDLVYFISNDKLYRYNFQEAVYDEIFTFQTHQRYWMRNHNNRVIVGAFNFKDLDIPVNPPALSTDITVCVFQDQSIGLVKVGQITINNVIQRSYSSNDNIRVFTSPMLTKFAFGYTRQLQNTTTNFVAQHVDYTHNQLINLTFQDPDRFIQTINSYDKDTQLDFNDYFLVVRNGSNYDMNELEMVPIEEAYQFTGSKIVFMRQRNLIGNHTIDENTNVTGDAEADRELFDFVKIYVDRTLTQRLVVLDLYKTSATTYTLIQWVYGNLATNRPLPTYNVSTYIQFEEPEHTSFSSPSSFLQWTYLNQDVLFTNFTVIQVDPTKVQHINYTSFSLEGEWDVLFENQKCKIIKEGDFFDSQISVYWYNSSSSSFNLEGQLESLLSNLTQIVDEDTQWYASSQCARIRIGSNVFEKKGLQGPYLPIEIDPTVILTAFSTELDYFIGDGGSGNGTDTLFRLAQNEGIVPFYTNGFPYPENSKIASNNNKIIIYSTNSTGATLYAFTQEGQGMITSDFNYSSTEYESEPKVYLSKDASKFLVLGTDDLSENKADFFHIDTQEHTGKAITFPLQTIKDPTQTFIALQDDFIYIRQLNSTPSSSSPPKHFVFHLAQETVPVQVFSQNIVFKNDTQWVKCVLQENDNGTARVFHQYLQGTLEPLTRIVQVTQISAQQSGLQNDGGSNYVSIVVDGKVKFCPPGCANCECSSCLPTYVLQSEISSCRPCPPGCLSCDSSNTSKCLQCASGTFLNSSTSQCDRCDSFCYTCQTNSTTCTSCPPTQYLQGSSLCLPCPQNCDQCTDNTTCSKCRKGFVLNSTGGCRSCAYGCSSCNLTNITQCTNCALGLQLVNSKCIACPQHCLECNGNLCAKCANGYIANTQGRCIPSCNLPCVTCSGNNPSFCLSCQSVSNLTSNGICQLDLSCNDNDSCTDCGQGFNYVLVPSGQGADCQKCPNIMNCAQCDQINHFKCSLCNKGHYIDKDGLCAACHSNCTSCKSQNVCTGCIPGYTLQQNISQGTCLKCVTPCATCQGQPKYCTSCSDGYSRQGWKCRNNQYVIFSFVISNGDPDAILSNIDAIVNGLLEILGLDADQVQAVTFESIRAGSAVISGTVDSQQISHTDAANALNTRLGNGLPGTNYTVSSVSATAVGGNSSQDEGFFEDTGRKVGLIVGLVVGIILLIAMIIVIIVCLRRRNSKPEYRAGSSQRLDEHENIVVENKRRNARQSGKVRKLSENDKLDFTDHGDEDEHQVIEKDVHHY